MAIERHEGENLLADQHNPPNSYDPPVICARMAEERDRMVTMRDG